MKKPPEELVESVLTSLKDEEGWLFDRFVAEHKHSGVEVWIGNEAWGVHISVPRYPDSSRFSSIRYDEEWGLLSPGWKKRLYRAAIEARDRSTFAKDQYAPVARAIAKLHGVA